MAEVAALESSIVFKGPQPLPNPRSTPESRDPSTYTRSIALSYQPCRYFDYIVGASTGGYVIYIRPSILGLRLTVNISDKPSCYDARSL